MSKSDYKLDVGKLKKDTEPTSAISFMAYEIENANNHNLSKIGNKGTVRQKHRKGHVPF